jgi:hypothetical protein
MTGNLPLFFERLRREFPAMNWPFALDFIQPEAVLSCSQAAIS